MSTKASQSDTPVVIKKYANRRLYDTQTSTYVTLDDLAKMVQEERDFVVFDAKTKEDLTRSVLTQIILERESKENFLLPANFLRQLIKFYGDSMQGYVPSYLEMSMASFTENQKKLREQLTPFGAPQMEAVQEQVRKNMTIFENAMRAFTPFGAAASTAPNTSEDRQDPSDADEHEQSKASKSSAKSQSARGRKSKATPKKSARLDDDEAKDDAIEDLQEQLAAIQAQLNKMK